MKDTKKQLLVYGETGIGLLVDKKDIKMSGELFPEYGEEALLSVVEDALDDGDIISVFDKEGNDLGYVEAENYDFAEEGE